MYSFDDSNYDEQEREDFYLASCKEETEKMLFDIPLMETRIYAEYNDPVDKEDF